MAINTSGGRGHHDYLLSRSRDDDRYGLWRVFDREGEDLLQPVPLNVDAKFDSTHQVLSIGRFLLEWGPQALEDYQPCFPYRLFEFDPNSPDPLNDAKQVQQGIWAKQKFWKGRPDFGNPDGSHKEYDNGSVLTLVPLGSFLLNIIPTDGRGTFRLWNFDPKPIGPPPLQDPLPLPYQAQGAFETIQYGHELIPLGNYVLDWLPETGEYWLWSFDPQSKIPLARPTIQQGRWPDIGAGHRLVAIGDCVLDWVPEDHSYRLWRFDAKSANPLTGPVRIGSIPDEFDAQTTLTGIQALRPLDDAAADVPGTIDFMRAKIKHVVYVMLENRSFDHACGWLYDNADAKDINFVGQHGPFKGASIDMFNFDSDPGSIYGQQVFLKKFNQGNLPQNPEDIDFLKLDPYHAASDGMRQLFYGNRTGYAQRAAPDMGGFVWNNGIHEVMSTYTPEQLPVLNGLAKHFAVSDEWFCSMPSETDPNRAFALTGSALGTLNNFQNDSEYVYWPETPHRPSIWKVLWTDGFTDWKIYNSVQWFGTFPPPPRPPHELLFVLTYHLFLRGQIPSVDRNIDQDLRKGGNIGGFDEFKRDAAAGKLPAFSFLEPHWFGDAGSNSYHPLAYLGPGEHFLNEIYDTLKGGPAWEQTLLIVTFDEHGGLYDHVPPPYAENPWPNDVNDGFRYDIMGVRVPTILVSPWIEKQTVFRSPTQVAYDSTSILATLLHWYGIPKSRWGLGDRTSNAPTFESVFQRSSPRPLQDMPSLKPPYSDALRSTDEPRQSPLLNDLYRFMTRRAVSTIVRGKRSVEESRKIANDILAQASDLRTLTALLDTLARRLD
jgi:phospholipase C